MKLICAQCGKEFENSHPTKRFCSNECYRRSQQSEQVCPVCGKTFLAPQHRNKKFCSDECLRQVRREKIALHCANCGCQFTRYKSLTREGQSNFFCSVRCKAEWQKKHLAGENNVMYGRTHTHEARAKIRAANKKQFEQPGARERHAQLTVRQISGGRTGKSFNSLEIAFAGIIGRVSVPYVQQYCVGTYVFDFFVPVANLLIEVNGTFWHADPRFYAPEKLYPVQRRNRQNDAQKADFARQEGYRLAVFWEHDIINAEEEVLQALQDLLSQNR